jgi:hypothetical protein
MYPPSWSRGAPPVSTTDSLDRCQPRPRCGESGAVLHGSSGPRAEMNHSEVCRALYPANVSTGNPSIVDVHIALQVLVTPNKLNPQRKAASRVRVFVAAVGSAERERVVATESETRYTNRLRKRREPRERRDIAIDRRRVPAWGT